MYLRACNKLEIFINLGKCYCRKWNWWGNNRDSSSFDTTMTCRSERNTVIDVWVKWGLYDTNNLLHIPTVSYQVGYPAMVIITEGRCGETCIQN